jgi:hypothetical protein
MFILFILFGWNSISASLTSRFLPRILVLPLAEHNSVVTDAAVSVYRRGGPKYVSCFIFFVIAWDITRTALTQGRTASVVYWSQFLATYPEAPGAIPGATRFSEK